MEPTKEDLEIEKYFQEMEEQIKKWKEEKAENQKNNHQLNYLNPY